MSQAQVTQAYRAPETMPPQTNEYHLAVGEAFIMPYGSHHFTYPPGSPDATQSTALRIQPIIAIPNPGKEPSREIADGLSIFVVNPGLLHQDKLHGQVIPANADSEFTPDTILSYIERGGVAGLFNQEGIATYHNSDQALLDLLVPEIGAGGLYVMAQPNTKGEGGLVLTTDYELPQTDEQRKHMLVLGHIALDHIRNELTVTLPPAIGHLLTTVGLVITTAASETTVPLPEQPATQPVPTIGNEATSVPLNDEITDDPAPVPQRQSQFFRQIVAHGHDRPALKVPAQRVATPFLGRGVVVLSRDDAGSNKTRSSQPSTRRSLRDRIKRN